VCIFGVSIPAKNKKSLFPLQTDAKRRDNDFKNYIFTFFFLNFKLQFFSIKTPHIFLGRTYFFSFLFLIEFLFTFILLEMGNNSMHQM